MTSHSVHDSLATLPYLQELQKQVCDLTAVKCDGGIRVHIECNQGRRQDAVVISHSANGRAISAYLTHSGWSIVARHRNARVWETRISPDSDVLALLEDRIVRFLASRSLYQNLLHTVKRPGTLMPGPWRQAH